MVNLIQPKLDEMKIVDDLMAELQVEAIDVARALVETKGKSVVTNALHSKATEIDERFNQLTARREAILRERQREQITDNDIDSMVEFGRDVSQGLTNPTPEQQRHWLESLQTKLRSQIAR